MKLVLPNSRGPESARMSLRIEPNYVASILKSVRASTFWYKMAFKETPDEEFGSKTFTVMEGCL